MNFNDIKLFLVFFIPFLSSLFLTPQVIKLAHHVGAIDVPKDDRRVHKKPIPRIGGLAIYSSFLLTALILGNFSKEMIAVIIGSFVLIFTGFIDDIKSINPKVKFLLQFIAASIAVIFGKLLISNITLFGYVINFAYFSYPLTIIFLVACMNIINLIDGIDGLASGISIIYFVATFVISVFQERFGTFEIFLSISLLGSTMGFLKYNFHPAKTFLGDTGSLFLGYMIGIISILGFKGTMITSLIVPFLLLAIPIMDTFFAILRRKIKGKKIFSADKEHIHHQMLEMKYSQKQTVLIIYLIQILFSAASILYLLKDKKLGIIVYIILFVIVLGFTLNTNIISVKINIREKKNKEKEIKEK